MREILETTLRDVEKETAPMRVLYEARKKEAHRESSRQKYQKKARMNTHGRDFMPIKPIADLSFVSLIDSWYNRWANNRINRVFPINTEGYLT